MLYVWIALAIIVALAAAFVLGMVYKGWVLAKKEALKASAINAVGKF